MIARALLDLYHCPGVSQEQLAAALERGAAARYESGDALCKEGEKGRTLIILEHGAVRVTRTDRRSGQNWELGVATGPAVLGHMAIIDGVPRRATCLAEGQVETIELDAAVVKGLLDGSSPEGTALRRLLLAALVDQLTVANQRIDELLQQADQPEKPGAGARTEQQHAAALRIAGTLDGWLGPGRRR